MSQSDSRSNRHPLKGLIQIVNEDFDLEEMQKIRDQWYKAFPQSGTMTGRFSSSAPNLCSLPKEEFKGVDYGDMEMRVVAAMYPGKDGIGCDIQDITEEVKRNIGMHPSLGAPYGVAAADVLRMEDVIYANTHKAKVLRFDPNKDSAEIEFADKNLIPPTMWVPVKDISQAWGGRVVNVQTHCPKCEVPWKETMLARFSCWDCPSCGAKKEDAVAQSQAPVGEWTADWEL